MLTPKILTTLPQSTPRSVLADLVAGVTVAMVALPLSLAIAIASGAPPATGLVTAIVGGFLISALGGSRVQIGGPTGAFIVVVYGVIAAHGFDGLVLATLMAGVILVIAGFLRAGSLIALVPEPVINGFTIGIAAIIALSQLPDAAGIVLAEGTPADALERVPAIWEARGTLDWPSLAVGAGTILAIVALRRAFPRFPGLILAVAGASAAVALLDLPVDTLGDRFGALPATLPVPALPEITVARALELLPSAFVIAFLAGVESLLSALVADRMVAGRHRPGAEILAQGVANIGSALMGGLPATGAIARTATNVRAGGRTPLAGIFHALTILGVMWAAAPLAGYLAMPALAGLLLVTAWNMSEPQHWRAHVTTGRRSDRLLLALTLVLTVFADLTVAIGVGVALGLALRLRRRAPPADWTPPER
ncbi:SulP family inorganic anion transporter [Roseibacterium sp. SDUM158017]|uniref:SulP family inorganic anion transporter n=1 Tax=Roseicyclus salinarum TaxID=3036773 RepID=UPI0024155816|nr:SulP family inorganic anion transporter [Roseibacterium sp. SDUM158017]MDG4648542.1 SulP family inorganic anion transporter [Roseibacterium sp. SDUM158017]